MKVKTKAECQENTSDESPAEEIEATMNDVVLTSSDDKTSERPGTEIYLKKLAAFRNMNACLCYGFYR